MNKKGYFIKTDKIMVKNEDVRAIVTQKSMEDFGFVKSDMLIDIFNAIKGVI